MKFRYPVLAAALIAACVLLSACGGGGSSSSGGDSGGSGNPEGLTIGLVFNTATDPNQQKVAKAVEEQASKYGYTVKTVDANNEAAKANSLMQSFATQQVDAIITEVFPASALQSGIRAADSAGVPVYMMYAFGEPSGVAAVVTQLAAEQQTDRMVEEMKGEGSVLAFTFHAGQPCVEGEKVFDTIMSENPGISVQKQEVPAPGWAQTADATTAAWLRSHPEGKEPLSIWGCWDGPNIGAISALRDAGRKDVKVYGDFGEAAAIQAVDKDEYTATWWFDNLADGRKIVDLIKKNAEAGGEPEPAYISSEPIEVDQENVKDFIKKYPQAVEAPEE